MAASACTHKVTASSVIPLGTSYPAEVKLTLREFEWSESEGIIEMYTFTKNHVETPLS